MFFIVGTCCLVFGVAFMLLEWYNHRLHGEILAKGNTVVGKVLGFSKRKNGRMAFHPVVTLEVELETQGEKQTLRTFTLLNDESRRAFEEEEYVTLRRWNKHPRKPVIEGVQQAYYNHAVSGVAFILFGVFLMIRFY